MAMRDSFPLGFIFAVLFHCPAHANDLCSRYKIALDQIRNNPSLGKNLNGLLTTSLSSAKSFEPTWFYWDQGSYVFPLPIDPKIKRREPNGVITLSGPTFTAVIGPDELLKNLAPAVVNYLKPKGVVSEFEYTRFLYNPEFFTCKDLAAPGDLEIKITLAKAKSVGGPFKLEKLYDHGPASTISLSGVHLTNNKWTTHLLIKTSPTTSDSALIFFTHESDQDKFISYLSQIRNRGFFKDGRKIVL